jgi:hypothetical protein
MAIKDFKNIEQKKGYRVEKKDRDIFEREVRRGLFGVDVGDIIEFILYDANDNPLPQEFTNGKLVRYISYTDENIKKYFSKVNQTKYNIKRNGADEFFIDLEKLIKEAGYSQGVFKTSVALLNRRLGSEERKFDRAWIHEISPSRTEVRVLPVIDESTGKPNSDLQTRYDTFTSGEDFAADVITFLDEFAAQFDIPTILKNMLTLRGKVADGEGYIKLIEKEFKIDNFERWLSLVKISFDKALDHFRNNRYSNILEQEKFGQPTGEAFGINFNSKGIIHQLCDIGEQCVNYHLPNQEIRSETIRTRGQQKTIDSLKKILKTVTSDGEFLAEAPTEKKPAIRGCRDPKATNYNAVATVDDICQYTVNVTKYKKIAIPPPPPPPPPPPRPSPPAPRPRATPRPKPASGNYSISASPIESQPSPKNGRLIQQFRMSSSPAITSRKTRYKYRITGAPSWCKITVQERSFSLPILRVRVYKNDGPARSGTVSFSSTLPGSPTTSVTISQAGTAVPAPKPKPKPRPKPKVDPDFLLNNSREDSIRQLSSANGLAQTGLKERYDTGDYGPMAEILSGCLVGNTQVEMSDGSFKSIKDVKIGDSLMGLDIKTLSEWFEVEDNWEGKDIEQYDNKPFKVTDTMVITEADVYSINDGLLECSDDHKHLIKRDDVWMIQTTSQLNPGDLYLDRDKNIILIDSIMLDRQEDVYLITLNGKHTYYANGILTHNYKGEGSRMNSRGFNTSSLYDGSGRRR